MYFKITLYLALCHLVVNRALKWEEATPLVVFGENATLKCIDLGSVCTHTRKWIGGKGYNLLALDNTSTNPFKYEINSDRKDYSFNLIIQKFNDDDVNCDYTCACGFQQYTKRLELTELNFVYPPNMNITDSSYQTDETLKLRITINKVFPLPQCSIIHSLKNNHVMEENLTLTTYKLKDLPFFKIDINQDIIKKQCADNVTLTCVVGCQNYTLQNWEVDVCKDIGRDNEVGIILGVFLSLLLMIVFCVFGKTFKKVIKHRFCSLHKDVQECNKEMLNMKSPAVRLTKLSPIKLKQLDD